MACTVIQLHVNISVDSGPYFRCPDVNLLRYLFSHYLHAYLGILEKNLCIQDILGSLNYQFLSLAQPFYQSHYISLGVTSACVF